MATILHRLATMHNAAHRQATDDRSIGIGRLCCSIGGLIIMEITLEIMDILVVLPLLFERNL